MFIKNNVHLQKNKFALFKGIHQLSSFILSSYFSIAFYASVKCQRFDYLLISGPIKNRQIQSNLGYTNLSYTKPGLYDRFSRS